MEARKVVLFGGHGIGIANNKKQSMGGSSPTLLRKENQPSETMSSENETKKDTSKLHSAGVGCLKCGQTEDGTGKNHAPPSKGVYEAKERQKVGEPGGDNERKTKPPQAPPPQNTQGGEQGATHRRERATQKPRTSAGHGTGGGREKRSRAEGQRQKTAGNKGGAARRKRGRRWLEGGAGGTPHAQPLQKRVVEKG
ncbi:unnamed protein product [Boreogadus saida]